MIYTQIILSFSPPFPEYFIFHCTSQIHFDYRGKIGPEGSNENQISFSTKGAPLFSLQKTRRRFICHPGRPCPEFCFMLTQCIWGAQRETQRVPWIQKCFIFHCWQKGMAQAGSASPGPTEWMLSQHWGVVISTTNQPPPTPTSIPLTHPPGRISGAV